MRGGGVLVLALLGSAGAFIVSPTIGPLARRGFVAPSTPVVPDRAFPVAIAELPKETNTFSRRAASLARCAPIPTCTNHPLTLDPLMMGLSGGGEGGCTSLALTLCEQGPSLPPHLAHLQPTQAPHPFARLMHPFSPLTPSPRCVCNLLADILCRFRPASSSWLRARPWFS